MASGTTAHLLKLADREYQHLTGKPLMLSPGRHFKPIRLNPAKLDSRWDRKRGSAVRLTAVLLGEDDAALERRVCANARSLKAYTAAAGWLQWESAYLRKIARLLDTAGTRVLPVLGRCKAHAAAAPSGCSMLAARAPRPSGESPFSLSRERYELLPDPLELLGQFRFADR